ncbi:hypothetical protein SAMN05880501_113108 [Ureibacillus xyleni]|uniref:Uncharacterized protein n=1 Tax=Ureibacillus xyleni TaxID=614648 RepID=A0A285TIT6_9BACL|nr:hypothetical protein [Ureibacillus xyleni]SOC22007.1 hypothetical protein SAMN05880501_113108 [Ureibacillus xyleni]
MRITGLKTILDVAIQEQIASANCQLVQRNYAKCSCTEEGKVNVTTIDIVKVDVYYFVSIMTYEKLLDFSVSCERNLKIIEAREGFEFGRIYCQAASLTQAKQIVNELCQSTATIQDIKQYFYFIYRIANGDISLIQRVTDVTKKKKEQAYENI